MERRRSSLFKSLVGTILFIGMIGSGLAGSFVSEAKAQAAQLEPCTSVGRGYFRVPGSSTCIAVAADVKTDYRHRSTRKEILLEAFRDEKGAQLTYSLGRLAPDRPLGRTLNDVKTFVNTATMTEFGLLTTSVGLRAQTEAPSRRPSDPVNEFNRTGRRTILEKASIKIGGFSAGLMPSFFDFTASLSYTTAYASEVSTAVFAYTRRMFGEVDLTVAIEDGTPRRVTDAAWGVHAGQRAPDIISSLRRQFSWGNVQFAAAAHPIQATGISDCCTPVRGDEIGWAAMAGLESWFDVGGMSGEFLLNAAASRGGLSFLNATTYPADFAISRDGRLFLTEGQAVVASYAHWWTKQLRTVLSASGFSTALETDTFHLQTRGLLFQGALEFIPQRGFVAGLEMNYHDDAVRGGDVSSVAPNVRNNFVSAVVYVRSRF